MNQQTPSREKLTLIQPSDELASRIAMRVREERFRLMLRRRIVRSLIGLVLSVTVFIPAAIWFLSNSAVSGFSEYASLVVSDGAVLAAYWKEYTLTLLETLPVIPALAVLAATYGVLASGAAVLRDSRALFSARKLVY